MSVDVLLHDIVGADEAQMRFLRESAHLLRKAVAMPGFGGSVRQADYGSTRWQGLHGRRAN